MEVQTTRRRRVLHGMMIKRLSEKYQQWNYLRRNKRKQSYSYRGIDLSIYPSVFSPEVTRTTNLFIDYLLNEDWTDKRVLELGAGSGLIGFHIANLGGKVLVTDVNPRAIEGLEENRKVLRIDIDIQQTSFFKNIQGEFDFVIINPPFFRANPKTMAERAWYCGEEFEFFETLFDQFSKRDHNEKMWMILSGKADINEIVQCAKRNDLSIIKKAELSAKNESHFVFEIRSYS